MVLRHCLSFLFISSVCIVAMGMDAPLAARLPDGRFIAEAYFLGDVDCSPDEWAESIAEALATVLPQPEESEKNGITFIEFRHFFECFLRGLDAVGESNIPPYKLSFVMSLKEKCQVFLAVGSYQELRDMVAVLQSQGAQSEKTDLGKERVDIGGSEELAGLHKEAIEYLVAYADKNLAHEPALCGELVQIVTNLKQVVCSELVPVTEFGWVMQQLSAILRIAHGARTFDQKQLTTIMTSCSAMIEILQKPLMDKGKILSKEK